MDKETVKIRKELIKILYALAEEAEEIRSLAEDKQLDLEEMKKILKDTKIWFNIEDK